MSPAVSHWYHVFAVPGWERIVDEHLSALQTSGLATELGVLHLGLVGPEEQREKAAARFRAVMPVEIVAEADEGWEQVTLTALHHAVTGGLGGVFLYAHTKGVAYHSEWNDAWRRSMTLCLVAEWRKCLVLLEQHAAVGCHWLTPPSAEFEVRNPFFGGNFWWAFASVIRGLEPPALDSRHDAEAWLGSAGLANVADRTPGWPSYGTIRGVRR
jgi:hypothetical protein